jgi:hypothetical protein
LRVGLLPGANAHLSLFIRSGLAWTEDCFDFLLFKGDNAQAIGRGEIERGRSGRLRFGGGG